MSLGKTPRQDRYKNVLVPTSRRALYTQLNLLLVADLFVTPTAQTAHVFLPLSSAVETEGTFTTTNGACRR
jgi:predicted molibdopterin-dependent oxidoreductase YjgC